jgi:hypothetical protein
MASFIQEPDMRALVAITDCVYALRQTEVKSCAALYSVADTNDTRLVSSSSSSTADCLGAAQRHHKLPTHNGERPSVRPAIATHPSHGGTLLSASAAPPVVSSTLSLKYPANGMNRHSVPRQGSAAAVRPEPRSPPRDSRRDDSTTVADLVDKEEANLHSGRLREDRGASMRRDHHHSHDHSRDDDAPRVEQNSTLLRELTHELRKKNISSRYNDGSGGPPRSRQLNIAPLPPTAATGGNSAQTSSPSASPPPRPIEKGSGASVRNHERTTTTTTFSTSNAKQEKKNGSILDDNLQRDSFRNRSEHPSTCSSINLSDVKPQSATPSAHTAPRHTDAYASSVGDTSQFLRSPPGPAQCPVSPPERFRREVQAHPRVLRESRSTDAAGSTAETGTFTSHKDRSADGSAAMLRHSYDRSYSHAATSVQSASPLTVTAAAGAHKEGSVTSHGTGVSRVSIRSATNSLSNQNSPLPVAPPLRATAADPVSLRHIQAEQGTSQRSSMRRDASHEESQHQQVDSHHSGVRSAHAAARAAQSAAHFVLDTRRRLSPSCHRSDEELASATQSRLSATPRSHEQSDNQRPLAEDVDHTTTLAFSSHVSPVRSTNLLESRLNLNITPTRTLCTGHTTPAAATTTATFATHVVDAGCNAVNHTGEHHHLSRAPAVWAAARGDVPRLASPPQKPRNMFPPPASAAAPLLPLWERSPAADAASSTTAMLRAAVHRMQQASSAAVDASTMPTPGPSSAEDRYALLVESARLLSSSVLVFTALAPGDRQHSTSAVRSASAVYATTPTPSRSRPHEAGPLPVREPLFYTSLKEHRTPRSSVKGASPEASPLPARRDAAQLPATVFGTYAAPTRDDVHARSAWSSSSPPPHSLPSSTQLNAKARRDEEAALAHSAEKQVTSSARSSSSGDGGVVASDSRPSPTQTMRRSSFIDVKPNTVPSVASSQQAKSSHRSSLESSVSGVSERRRAVPAPDMIWENSQVSHQSSAAFSTRRRRSSSSSVDAAAGVAENLPTADVDDLRSTKGSSNSGSKGGRSAQERESSARQLRSRSGEDGGDGGDVGGNSRDAANHSSRSSAALVGDATRPAPPPPSATQLFPERDDQGEAEAWAEGSDSRVAAPPAEVPKRYYAYASPEKSIRLAARRETVPFGLLQSHPHATSSLTFSPATPPPLASPGYRSPLAGKASAHGCLHCAAEKMEGRNTGDDDGDVEGERAGQPTMSERSPRYRKLEHSPAAKKLEDPRNAHGPPLHRETVAAHSAESADWRGSGTATRVAAQTMPQDSPEGPASVTPNAAPTSHQGDFGEVEEVTSVNDQLPDYTCAHRSNSDGEDEAPCRPRCVQGRDTPLVDVHNSTPSNLTSFSNVQLMHYQSADSSASAFEWVAEDYAAAQQRYHDPSGGGSEEVNGGSPFSAPSASESRTSFGQIVTSSALHGPHTSSSLSVDGLSHSDFSIMAPPRRRHSTSGFNATLTSSHSVTPPPQVSLTSNAPFSDLPHPSDAGDHPSHPLARHGMQSLSFTGSCASLWVQSTMSAERTPTAPSMMNAAVLEMSTGESRIPHAAALFADPFVASSTSVAVEPAVEDVEGQVVLWVDEAGHHFTQPDLIDDGDADDNNNDKAQGLSSKKARNPRYSDPSPRHSGASTSEIGRSDVVEENDGRDPAASRSSRQSIFLRSNAPVTHRRDSERLSDRRSEDEGNDNGDNGGDDDTKSNTDVAPPLRSYHAATPAPVLVAHGSRRSRDTSSSKDCSTMSSASTSPARAERSHDERRRSAHGDENSTEGEMRQQRSVASTALPLSRETSCGGDDGGSAAAALPPSREKKECYTRSRSGRSTFDDDVDTDGRSSSFWVEVDAQNGKCQSAHHAMPGEGPTKGKEQRGGSLDDTGAASSSSVATDTSAGQDGAHHLSYHHDSEGTAAPPHAAPVEDPTSRSQTLSSSASRHLPPPLPKASAAVAHPRIRLSAPGGLTKPPMVPKSSRPRLAEATHGRTLSSPMAPDTNKSASEGRDRDTGVDAIVTQVDHARHSRAFVEDADFFEEGNDGDDDYCGYGFDGGFVEV